MKEEMNALVYQGPRQMPLCVVPIPEIKPDEVLIKVAYSGICGSELSGYLGTNSLRKPPLIMGHEFSGTIEQIGAQAAADFPEMVVGKLVTANPLISCGHCGYCQSGRHQLCPKRKLLSASLPGSNAQYVTVVASALYPIPEGVSPATAALTEPTACTVHVAEVLRPRPSESALVVGAGPIGLLTIQALQDYGLKTITCADLNRERLAMAESLGAVGVCGSLDALKNSVDIAIDAVGLTVTRQACVAATRAGGRVAWIGLHEAESALPINDIIRREITAYGSFAYTHADFAYALEGLAKRRFWLDDKWTRVEPLERGAACFDELLGQSAIAKIWLMPW